MYHLEEPRRVVFLPSNLVSLGNIVEEELKPTTTTTASDS